VLMDPKNFVLYLILATMAAFDIENHDTLELRRGLRYRTSRPTMYVVRRESREGTLRCKVQARLNIPDPQILVDVIASAPFPHLHRVLLHAQCAVLKLLVKVMRRLIHHIV
jgi:hypothetical protein